MSAHEELLESRIKAIENAQDLMDGYYKSEIQRLKAEVDSLRRSILLGFGPRK